MNLLIRYVSGVPLLEKKFKAKYPEEFEQYCKETAVFIPALPNLKKKDRMKQFVNNEREI